MKDVIHITIGICAYNEEENIAQLLKSIILQKHDSHVLDSIIVVSDGSTDKTENIVKKIQQSDKRIVLHSDGLRKGKTSRLNELFALHASEILLVLDADVVFKHTTALDTVAQYFTNKKVGIVGLSLMPVPAETYFGKAVVHWHMIWSDIANTISHGDSPHNIRGAAFAIRRSLVKGIRIPAYVQQVARYLYHYIYTKKYVFKFAKTATVLYRIPMNTHEYISTLRRGNDIESEIFVRKFGEKINETYNVSMSIKLKILFRYLRKNTRMTLLSILCIQLVHTIVRCQRSVPQSRFWEVTPTTKKAIKI